MPVPSYVAPNELIESAWGNSVVDNLQELHDEFALRSELITACLVNTTSIGTDDTWNNWLTYNSVTIPTGVSYIIATVCGVTASTADSTHVLRLTLDGNTAAAAVDSSQTFPSTHRVPFAFNAKFTSFGGDGSCTPIVQSNRVSGSGSGRLAYDYPVSGSTITLRCYGA